MSPLARCIPVIALLSLALAAGLKVARYGAATDLTDSAALRHVVPFLETGGWTATGPASGRAGNLYTWMAFTRADCPQPITIAFLGTSSEAQDLVRLDHDGDVAFVQGGAVVTRPSGLHRQVAGLQAAVARLLGWQAPVALPLLAIAPAPKPFGAMACAGPTTAQWQAFARGEIDQIRTIANRRHQPE